MDEHSSEDCTTDTDGEIHTEISTDVYNEEGTTLDIQTIE